VRAASREPKAESRKPKADMPSNILVPELGESIVDARVARWLKQPGEAVAAGDPLVELETDKIDVEVGAPQAGVLGPIARGEGDDVKIGDVLGVVEDPSTRSSQTQAALSESKGARSGQAPEAPPGSGGSPTATAPAEAAAAAGAGDGEAATKATPSARKLARQHHIDLGAVTGTGDGGRVTRRDVEAAVDERAKAPAAPSPAPAQPATAPAPSAAPARPAEAAPRRPAVETPALAGVRREDRVRMTRRRLTIAKRLVEAQHNAAMLTTFNEVDMTAVMELRERRKQAFKDRHGVGLGIASFFVRAAVGALREFPELNAEIQGDEIVLKRYYDIGIAVGAEGGLVVPVLRDADRLSFAAVELGIREFAKRAGDGTLTLEDLRGGTFTITNGGVFGSLLSTPILNPPQVAILGLHKIEARPVAVGGQVQVRPMMYVALSYDHRVVDGRESVQFLARIKELVEDPAALLLEV